MVCVCRARRRPSAEASHSSASVGARCRTLLDCRRADDPDTHSSFDDPRPTRRLRGAGARAERPAAIGLVALASPRLNGVVALQGDVPTRSATMVLVAGPGHSSTATAAPVQSSSSASPASIGRPAANRPAARTIVPAAAAPAQPVVFYGFRDVDSPAFPVSDWNIDVDALDALGTQRLVFEALVDDRGDIVGCTVIEPANVDDATRRALEQRLSATQLLPALRGGSTVASVRRIELQIDTAPVPAASQASDAPPAHRS